MVKKFSTVNAQEAAEILRSYGLRIGAEAIRQGIRVKQLPFGFWIPGKSGGTGSCTIFYNKLMDWINENAADSWEEKQW